MVTKVAPSAESGRGVASDYVFAVIDSPLEVARAAEALRQAKFAEDDIAVLGGTAPPDRNTAAARRRTVAGLFVALTASWDGAAFEQRVLSQLRMGHAILAVYAPGSRKFERAIGALEGCHAHAL
ncbi:MAG: hypothetical protein ACRDHP_17735 [Ktedonobacterales bacterium]